MGKRLPKKKKPKKRSKKESGKKGAAGDATRKPQAQPTPLIPQARWIYIVDTANIVGTFGWYGVELCISHLTSMSDASFVLVVPSDLRGSQMESIQVDPERGCVVTVERKNSSGDDDVRVITLAREVGEGGLIVTNDNYKDHFRKTLKGLDFMGVERFVKRRRRTYTFVDNGCEGEEKKWRFELNGE